MTRVTYLSIAVLGGLLSGSLFGLLFLAPLIFYGVSVVFWVCVRVFRADISGLGVRVALFWSLLAASPAWMAYGFFSGLLGETTAVEVIGFLALAAFIGIFAGSMRGILAEVRAA